MFEAQELRSEIPIHHDYLMVILAGCVGGPDTTQLPPLDSYKLSLTDLPGWKSIKRKSYGKIPHATLAYCYLYLCLTKGSAKQSGFR